MAAISQCLASTLGLGNSFINIHRLLKEVFLGHLAVTVREGEGEGKGNRGDVQWEIFGICESVDLRLCNFYIYYLLHYILHEICCQVHKTKCTWFFIRTFSLVNDFSWPNSF